MRIQGEAVKADVKEWIIRTMRQSVARNGKELCVHVVTLHKWRKT